MLTNPARLGLYIPGAWVKSPRNNLPITLTTNQSPMITGTVNQERTGVILHLNCQSDGTDTRWIEDGREGSEQAKKEWLSKLGCMLKFNKDIEC